MPMEIFFFNLVSFISFNELLVVYISIPVHIIVAFSNN